MRICQGTALRFLFLGILVAWVVGGERLPAAEAAQLSILTNLQDVVALGPDRARQNRQRVEVQMIVTFTDSRRARFYAQEGGVGMMVFHNFREGELQYGQLVEVEGFTLATDIYPFIQATRVQVLKTGLEPQATRISPQRLMAGEQPFGWVEVEGDVRDLATGWGNLQVRISSEGQRFSLMIGGGAAQGWPVEWLDARVRARGMCLHRTDAGRPTDFNLYLPSVPHLEILRPGVSNVFARPIRSIRSLREGTHAPGARLKFAGTVTYARPDVLFLQDETGALQARMLVPGPRSDPNGRFYYRQQFPTPRPGDRIEIVGAPVLGELAPLLEDVEIRPISQSMPATATVVNAETLSSGEWDARLVMLRARLLDRRLRRTGAEVEQELILTSGGKVFSAMLHTRDTNTLFELPPQALVQVTGICSLRSGEWKRASSFQLLLRDAADVEQIGLAAPWDAWPVGRLLLFAGALGLGAILWIWFLRRRVAQRTAELATSNYLLQSEIEERKRAHADLARALESEKELNALKSNFVNLVSHEFRTPLGVILSSSEILDSYLDTLSVAERAEHMRDIKECTRYMSGLMEDVLMLGRVEAGKVTFRPITLDVAEFCRRITDEVLSATNRVCPIEFSARGVEDQARGDESLLRHMFGNLLSNAVKYSSPGSVVTFSVERVDNDAVFTVSDGGIGIPAEDLKRLFSSFHRGQNVGERPGSGLGLVIVQHCVQLHGGMVNIQSKEGMGTTATVRLPLFVKTGHTDFYRRSTSSRP